MKRLNLSFSDDEWVQVKRYLAKSEFRYLREGTSVRAILLQNVTKCNETLQDDTTPTLCPACARDRSSLLPKDQEKKPVPPCSPPAGNDPAIQDGSQPEQSGPELTSPPEPDPQDSPQAVCKAALTRLNELAGTKYRPSGKAAQDAIQARLRDGWTKEDILRVVEVKHREWGNDPKMARYLRPSTLFRRSNFEDYAGQKDHGPAPKSYRTDGERRAAEATAQLQPGYYGGEVGPDDKPLRF